MDNRISSFKISGHSTKREWAVYLVVATSQIDNKSPKLIYVGKVGDNRDGCNPVISRVGNHFSFNTIHSQVRNRIDKIGKTEDFDYEYYYAHFGEYKDSSKLEDRNRINELERRLNSMIQDSIADSNEFKLLNVYEGKYIKQEMRDSRANMLNDSDIKTLNYLINKALTANTPARADL